MVRYGMVIDLKRCIGCNTCTVACRVENFTPPGILWCRVEKIEVGKYPNARLISVPMSCMHCGDAPCVKVCPTGASHKLENGIVLVDYEKCTGGKACMGVCPYKARQFVEKISEYYPGKGFTPYEQLREKQTGTKKHIVGVVEKCTFCVDRVNEGKEPFCVETCVGNARTFGDLDDPNSRVSTLITERHASQLRAELGTDPSIFYIPP